MLHSKNFDTIAKVVDKIDNYSSQFQSMYNNQLNN